MATPSQAPAKRNGPGRPRGSREGKPYDYAASRYRARNRTRINERMRVWREKNREKTRRYALDYRARKLSSGTLQEQKAFRQEESRRTKDTIRRVKFEVYNAYGGYKCRCCGVTEECFLSIDHVDNNGYAMKKSGAHPKQTATFYRWLRENKFPPGFQILCMNCQFGKKNNGGVCPHQQVKA